MTLSTEQKRVIKRMQGGEIITYEAFCGCYWGEGEGRTCYFDHYRVYTLTEQGKAIA